MEYHYGQRIKTNEMDVNCRTERIYKKIPRNFNRGKANTG
jgi:hypothetical protein